MKYKIVNCPHCGKIIPHHILSELIRKTVNCPHAVTNGHGSMGKERLAMERFNFIYAKNAASGSLRLEYLFRVR